jgi:hypothetical protein
MSLVPYTITALELNQADATASGKQVVVGASCSMFIQPADTVVLLYDDAAASNGSTAKTTGLNGQVTVYIQPGSYRVVANSISRFVQVGQDKATTTVGLIASTDIYPADTVVNTTGFTASGDGSGGTWKQNGVTGQTVSQSPAQLGYSLLNDGNGNQWALVINRQLFMPKVGLKTGQDNYSIFKIAQNVINNNGPFISIAFPIGDFTTTASSEYVIDIADATNFSIIGNQTRLSISSGVGSVLRLQRSTIWRASGLILDSNQTAASGFHGVAVTDCQSFNYEKGEVHNSGGYGIGLQGDTTASYENCVIENMRIVRAGADGIDFKNNEGTNEAITLTNLYIEDPSWLNNLKPALDLRGPCVVSNIQIVFKNNVNFDMVGVRTRQTVSGLEGSRKSTLTNIIVDDKTTGRSNVGFALVESDTVQSNLTAKGCKSSGFQISDQAINLQLLNCIAKDCNSGFFNSGVNSKLMFCQALNSDTEGFRSSGNTSSTYAFCEAIGSGTIGFRSASGATGMDLAYCKASGSGVSNYSVGASARVFMSDGYTGNSTLQTADSDFVKFGTSSTIGSETLTGYVYIRDLAGNLVKLAVVS